MPSPLDQLREYLIAAIHSDPDARSYFETRLDDRDLLLRLCAICAPYDKYSNDCRMQAAYYISKFSSEALSEVVPLLAIILTIPDEGGEDMNGNIACHIIKAIRSALPHFDGKLYQDLDALSRKYGCE